MTKEKQINLAGIDLLSFSLFTGAAVEQDLRRSPWDAHLLWARPLRVRRDHPQTQPPLGVFPSQQPTNWHSSPCGNLRVSVCVISVLIYIKRAHVWVCMHFKDECGFMSFHVCMYACVSVCTVYCTVYVPAVQCCLQEECVMGISSFSWLPGALLQICSRCVWCVCFVWGLC